MSEYSTGPEKIDEEGWDWSLGCLPPCRWHNVGPWEVFHLSELYTEDIAYWFATDNKGNYFKFRDRVTISDADILKKLERVHDK